MNGHAPPGRLESRLLAVILFLAPLVVWPPGADSFVLPKWAFLAVAALALGVALLAGALGRLPLRLQLHPANGLLLAWVLWRTLSVAWASSRPLAWQDVRHEWMLFGLVLMAQSLLAGRRDRILLAARAVGWASCAVAAWALALDAGGAFGWWGAGVRRTLGDWRDLVSAASLGNSGHVGDFLALGFLVWLGSFVLAVGRTPRAVAIAALWLHAAALIVAWSVHSNLSLIIASAAFAWMMRGDSRLMGWRRRARDWGMLAAGFAFVIAFLVVDHPANPHGSRIWARGGEASGGIFAQAFSSDRWHAGGETRVAIWLTTLEMIRERPWLGVGAGNHPYNYPATMSPIVMNDPGLARYASTWTNAAHNDFLQSWAETGAVGAFLLVALFGCAFKRAHDRSRRASPATRAMLALASSMLLAQLVQMQMSFPLELPVSSLLFMLLVVVPEHIPSRGPGRDESFLVLVQRHIGPLRVRVGLENMQIPRELGLSLPLGAGARLAVAAPVAALALVPAWRSLLPVLADTQYRVARAARPPSPPMQREAPNPAFERAALATLEIWPGHVDCRSAYSGHLVRTGRWKEAVAQSLIVVRSLNATEVHLRLALSYDALGQGAEAAPHWREWARRTGTPLDQLPPSARLAEPTPP